jgi:serine/threonine-protein kinase ATR
MVLNALFLFFQITSQQEHPRHGPHMMAPVSRNGIRSNVNPNGVSEMSGACDAPPSTMAAQLINNLSTTRKPVRPIEQDDLAKLMSEVSEAENNHVEPEDALANIEHKHKLIYVFSRAVLEKLSKDDPFMNVEQLVSQASGALDVFIATIRETPGVLAYTIPTGSILQGRGREPLWIWLFPRLLSLLGRQNCEALNEKIKDLFYESFQAVSRSPKLWSMNSAFFTYLKDCTSSKSIFSTV